MELKPKFTMEIEEWQEVTVEDIKAPFENALATGPFGSSIGSRFFQDHGIPVIRGSNLSQDLAIRLNDNGLVFISREKATEFKRSIVRRGDLIFTCWGTINQVGLIDDRAKYLEYVISNKQMKFTPDQSKADSLFLYYLFSSHKIQDRIKNQSIGSSVPGFNLGQLRSIKFRIPTLNQQKSIAQALSDVDAAIAELDRLITKKRNIKQGTMQQLLTGKKRLTGFSGEWEKKQISKIAPLQRGFDLPTSQLVKGNYPVVYSNGILNFHNKFQVKAPGVVTGRSGTIGKVTFVEKDYWPHNTSLWVTDFKQNDPKFIYYLYVFIGFEKFGTGSGVPTLNRNDVHAFDIPFPSTVEEQKAVAQVLTDMDTEIEALEQKRDKYKAIKQGMMQELLTGRTRLV